VIAEFSDPDRLARLGVARFRAFAARRDIRVSVAVAQRLVEAARQIYRAAGLTPSHYESAGTRRDGAISREGSVELRRALLDLGVGLWHSEPAARCYATRLRQRGKPGGIIATAMARIAGRLAYAMVRDQTAYDPTQRRS